MPIDPNARALLDDQLRQLKDLFETGKGRFAFKSARDDYLKAVHRELSPNVPQNLQDFGNYFEVQSAILEWEVREHLAARMLGAPKSDATSLEDNKDAKRDVEEINTWNASWMLRDDEGGKSRISVFTNMLTMGVAVTRDIQRQPTAVSDEEGDPREAEIKQHEHTFQETYIDPRTMFWGPDLDDPDVLFEEAEVTAIQAKSLRDSQGKYPTLDSAGKVMFLGPGEPVDSAQSTAQREKRLKFVRRNMRVPESGYRGFKAGAWIATEYICGPNAKTENYEELVEYEIPSKRPEYFIIPAGTVRPNETDPHYHYPPILKPLIVAVCEANFLWTVLVLAGLGSLTVEKVYASLAGVNPDTMNNYLGMIRQLSQPVAQEGQPAQRAGVLQAPEPGSNEINLMPPLAQWPQPILDQFLQRLDYLNQVEIPMYRTNRFLTGQAFQEATSGSATGLLAQQEAAGIGPSMDLTKYDTYRETLFWGRREAILTWDEVGEKVDYPLVTTSREPVRKGTVQPGKEIVVNAEKLSRHFTVNVETSAKTQQERQTEAEAAYRDFDRNIDPLDRLLQRLGIDDPQARMNEIDRENQRIEAEQQFAPVLAAERSVLWQALTGLNLTALQGGGQPMEPSAPSGNGGAPPPGGNGLPAGRFMAPPPIQGPQDTRGSLTF